MKLATIDNRQAALDYAAKGWSVLPLLPKKKDPHFDLIKQAYLSATTDLSHVKFSCL
jgi:hypothetical protein